jgi:uncharacterized damage-inducible protein DinB
MEPQPKELLVLDDPLSQEPEIGRWLAALQDARLRTMRVLEGLSPAMCDWLPGDNESSIGTILYHMADIEADWLYVEGLGQEVPPEVMAAHFPYPTRDERGRLTQIQGFSLAEHLRRLATVRGLVLDSYRQMALAEFRLVRSFTHYDVTPEYVLHHLMQHEAEHRSQIGSLRARAERALADPRQW